MSTGADSPVQGEADDADLLTPALLLRRLEAAAGGPYDPDATAAVAWLAAETVRYLNYATRTGEGVQHASTLYTVVGALSLAADRIPQLASQAVYWLEANSGCLANDDGSPVCDTLDDAALSSQAAADAARLLALHLRELQNARSPSPAAVAALVRPKEHLADQSPPRRTAAPGPTTIPCRRGPHA